ncbi:MAG: glutamate 5-kinase [Bifidobacteriaceae bacterium]|jgi:glutamate 5-kinase|nr:glutamate 5-kinase [Bifidobacteriaceae bacterium]
MTSMPLGDAGGAGRAGAGAGDLPELGAEQMTTAANQVAPAGSEQVTSGGSRVAAAATSRAAMVARRRLVVKIGSSALVDAAGRLSEGRLGDLVDGIVRYVAGGHEVVLVSSGAQAAGLEPLGLNRRPKDLAQAQAAASVGQGRLMAAYSAAFGAHGLTVGQVLLTAEDTVRRSHYRNALRVLGELLHRGVVPIVNENDAVATDEIRFGDNDRLAALVAHLVRADGLVLLTDVDALYDKPPGRPDARPVRDVVSFDDVEALEVTGRGSRVGTGGMVTKVQAAAMASSSGIPVLLAAAQDVRAALAGAPDVGTYFRATGRRLTARRMWLGYAAALRGRLTVDDGAARAITDGKKSLLAVGVTGVDGDFAAGDPVAIVTETGQVLARGLAGFGAADLRRVKGLSEDQIVALLGPGAARAAVHRDELATQARSRRPDGPAA